MQTFQIKWKAWYGDEPFDLAFPDNWDIIPLPMKHAPDIGEGGIVNALNNPIGSSQIPELARESHSCAITFDDLARPTKVYRILRPLLKMLLDGGIVEDRITLIPALGAHRPMVRQDFIKKCGQDVVDRFRILNHQPFDNLIDMGQSSRGTPIRINKDFWDADLKIGIGGITPHPYAGFGGGGKIVLPGLSGIETLEANHRSAAQGLKCKMADVDENPCREDIDEIAKKVGLRLLINVVSGPSREVSGVFVGDPILAHREGIRFALEVYGTRVPSDLDIAVLNAYPKDLDITQTPTALNIGLSIERRLVRRGGALVIVAGCPEGAGYHSLEGYQMRLYSKFDSGDVFRNVVEDSHVFFFSPNVNKYDVSQYYSDRIIFFKKWDDVITRLNEIYQGRVRVGVVPFGSLQIAQEL